MTAFKTLIATFAIAAAALATTTAQATTIDFNGQANGGANYLGTSSYTTGGLTFTGANISYLIGTSYSNRDSNGYAFNGSDYYMAYQSFTVQAAAPFSVNSLDFAQWADGNGVSQVTLTGNFAGGSITKTLDLDTRTNASKLTGNDFTTFNLTGFNNLTSLTVSHNGTYYLALDNLVINAATVPEPSSIALFGLALAAGAVVRRRRSV